MFILTGQYLTYASVTLPNPSFGDTNVYDTNTRFARTRQGEPRIIHDDGWPCIETRQYNFEVLTEDNINELISFLTETAAEPVYMADYNGEKYLVLVTNTEYLITTIRDECNYNIPLEVLILESIAPSEEVSPIPVPV